MQYIILALILMYFFGWDNFLIILGLLVFGIITYTVYLVFFKEQETIVTNLTSLPIPNKQSREAIPKTTQREVWQRDGGKCVDCGTKEQLCYDHIIPFSRGGSNTVRNIQLLCERCNLTKGNRI